LKEDAAEIAEEGADVTSVPSGDASPPHKQLSLQQKDRLESLAKFIGQTPRTLNVFELRDLLEQRLIEGMDAVHEEEEEDNTDVAPLLLRFVNGEFHYGQRSSCLSESQQAKTDEETVTKKTSEGGSEITSPRTDTVSVQRIVDRAASRSESRSKAQCQRDNSLAGDRSNSRQPSRGMATLEVFNVLVDESRYRHLHQLAGWVDIDEAEPWNDYVADVMDGLVEDGDMVFEAGCGVLAFLTTVGATVKLGGMGGMDGAARTIQLVKDKLVEPSQRENFYVGLLPYGLSPVKDASWDVVFCNSVMQYIPSEEHCRTTVHHMLRITKRWVIIADICDATHEDRARAHRKRLQESNAAEGKKADDDAMVDYKCYHKSWWLQFESLGHLVTVRHVRVKSYTRRSERYCVYIEKNAGIVTSP